MFGLGEAATTLEAQIVLSAVVAVVAFGSAYVVRRARVALSDRIAADDQLASIAVDVVGAALSVGIVVAAAVAVADIWDETDRLLRQFGDLGAQQRVAQIAVTIVVLIAVQVFASVARRLLDDIAEGSNALSEHERELSYRLIQLTLWTVGIVVVLGVWEVNLGGLLVGAGFLGIVFGLAARQTLGSMLGGLVLMFSRPFEVGDWVAVGPEEDEGIVTDISVMNTSIQAFDGEFVVVPNDVISSQTVKNRTRKGRLRIEVEVGVDYATDLERAREVATEAIADVDMIMDVPRPESVTKSFDDSAITIGVRGWIEHPSSRRRWRARTRMIRTIKRRFSGADVKIPFPQRELSGRREQGGLQVADDRHPERADGDAHEPEAATESGRAEPDPSDAAADSTPADSDPADSAPADSPPAEEASGAAATDAATDSTPVDDPVEPPPTDGAQSDGADEGGTDQ